MFLLILKQYWWEILLAFIGSLFIAYISYQRGEIKDLDNKIIVFQANEKLNEIQKDALRSTIVDQNNAVEKQRVDAVQRTKVFKVKSDMIQANYERERLRVRELNGSQECDEIRKMIKGAV
jgi:hypothetical protein